VEIVADQIIRHAAIEDHDRIIVGQQARASDTTVAGIFSVP
jgi:hypothetical protein